MNTPEARQSKIAQGVDGVVAAHAHADQGSTRLKRHLLLRRFWRSATGFWRSGGDRLSWILSGTILLTVLLSLATSYGMNIWNRQIFDALERRDGSTVLFWSLAYFPLLMASVCLAVAQVYAQMTIQRRWRAWLNNHVLDRWLTNGRYYQLNLVNGDHANPEYRIADDIRAATEAPVDFATGVATAVLSAATFIVVLWTIGGSLTFGIAGVARRPAELGARSHLPVDPFAIDYFHQRPTARHQFGCGITHCRINRCTAGLVRLVG
jgi:ABC-type uncharacterized transport system fused permease/ATPase subunit